jgi:glucose-6-phosphate dehydrogenase assembly protein OpcA
VRVRVLNLVATGADAADIRRFEEVMQTLPQRHPCRGVFAVASSPYRALSATISAHCRRTGTARRHVCSEEVVLTGANGHERQVASAVRGLLVPDLPVALWLLHDPASPGAVAPRLMDACDTMIVDSGRASLLARTYSAIMRVDEAHEAPLLDLAWARLAPWRALIAQMFDGAAGARELAQIEDISIAGGRDGVPSSEAALLAGWLASRLSFALADVTTHGSGLSAALYDGTRSVDVRIVVQALALDGITIRTPDTQFAIARHGDTGHLHVREEWDSGATRRVVDQPVDDEGALIALTLDGMGEVATYRDALSVATALAAGQA